MRKWLLELRETCGIRIIKSFGYLTKMKRRILKLRKKHFLDAVAITYHTPIEKIVRPRVLNKFIKICTPKGDYQQTTGARSTRKVPTGKIQGFRKFDVVEYLKRAYIIKGRMSRGYAFLMDSTLKVVKLYPIPKFSQLTRIQARSSWVVMIE